MKNLPDPSELHVSIIPSRNPRVKVHANLGDARKAIGITQSVWRDEEDRWQYGHAAGQIYNLVDGEWNLLYDIKDRDQELPWQ